MRRTLGVACSERQWWCELLPFAALVEQQADLPALHRTQLATLVSYSSGVEKRPVASKQAVASVSVLRQPADRQVQVAESAVIVAVEDDDVEDAS